MSSVEIVPTIVPTTLSDIRKVSDAYASFARFFQIDLTDGKFAPNTTWLPAGEEQLPKEYGYEVHLMVADPASIGLAFAKAGARRVIAHVESLQGVEQACELFEQWRKAGAHEIGLAMLLQTSFDDVEPYLALVDYVLLMTIARIGVQGIPYEASAPARVAEFHRRWPRIPIAVDGGVSERNIEELARAGARRFGVGSAIAKAPDPAAAYARLTQLAKAALAPNDALPLTGQA